LGYSFSNLLLIDIKYCRNGVNGFFGFGGRISFSMPRLSLDIIKFCVVANPLLQKGIKNFKYCFGRFLKQHCNFYLLFTRLNNSKRYDSRIEHIMITFPFSQLMF